MFLRTKQRQENHRECQTPHPLPPNARVEDTEWLMATIQPNGKGVAYFPSGVLALRGTFENGYLTNGQVFRKSGVLQFHGKLRNNELVDGMLYDTAGRLLYEGAFQNGKPSGLGMVVSHVGDAYFSRFQNGDMVWRGCGVHGEV